VQTTTNMVAQFSLPLVLPMAAPDRSGDLNVVKDVTPRFRSTKTMSMKQKFDDVFKVSGDCVVGVESDFDGYTDDVSVAGRLSDPKAVKFFRSIGLPR
jgi:hypothetical protein